MDKKKVLFVDDEEMNTYLFKLQLEEYLEISLANLGKEGLEILNENDGDFDVVISDLRMPLMNGFEFLEHVKKKYPKIERCILTAHERNAEINKSLKSGLIAKYFMKPIDIELFLKFINR